MFMELFVLFNLFILMTAKQAYNKCRYIDYKRKYTNTKLNHCKRFETCKKNFQISHVDIPPYSTSQLLEKIIMTCCGECTKITIQNRFTNITEVSPTSMNSSHFIVPFLGRSTADRLYGYHFIPLIDVPSAFYFTPKRQSSLQCLVEKYMRLYPLIVVCLLMAVILGFIVWLIEANNDQFPKSFVSGLFNGFWFTIVSMTTVGYGDLVVKTIPAKIFSVILILLGMIMFGLLTSMFTTVLINAMRPEDHSMSGAHVGVLKYRDYDASLVVREGGVINETKASNFSADIFNLIQMLRKDEIDGFLIDKYTAAYVSGYFEWKKSNRDWFLSDSGETYDVRSRDIEFFEQNTYRSLKTYQGEKLSYGVMVKDVEDYEFFKEAIRDNRLGIETSTGIEMNKMSKRQKNANVDIFDISEGFFVIMKWISGVMSLICLFGVIYETCRCKFRMSESRIQMVGEDEAIENSDM